jgi:tripartite-type tricarboxylate transporter receptor subunit TctC
MLLCRTSRRAKFAPIAVSSLQRNPLYPDVPTVAESGYKDFQALSWSGLSVAKGTPPAIVEKLEAAMVQALQSEAVRQRLTSVGFVVPTLGGSPYTQFCANPRSTLGAASSRRRAFSRSKAKSSSPAPFISGIFHL